MGFAKKEQPDLLQYSTIQVMRQLIVISLLIIMIIILASNHTNVKILRIINVF